MAQYAEEEGPLLVSLPTQGYEWISGLWREVDKGRNRIEEKGQLLCLTFKLPVERELKLPYGLGKQFLFDSFLIKKKDPFVNQALYLSHVSLATVLQRFYLYEKLMSRWEDLLVNPASLSLIQ
jgi:hypothetical protein